MAERKVPIFSQSEIEEVKRAIPAMPKFSPDEIREARIAIPEDKGFIDKAGFAARSALEGQTAGLSEPVIGRAKALYASVTGSDTYDSALQKDVENRRLEKAQMPGLDIAAQIGGGLIPSPINVAGKVGTLANWALKGVKVADAAKDASALARVVQFGKQAGKLGLAGGLSGLGYEGTRQAALRVDGYLDKSDPSATESLGTAAGYGGAIGAGLPVAGAAIKGGAALGKWGAGKAMESVLGVPVATQSEYLANSARIKSARTVEQIKDVVDSAVKQVQDDLDSARISKQEAKEALRDLGAQVRDNLADAKWDARDTVRRTESQLQEAWNSIIEPIKSKRAPTHLAGEASALVQDLKGKVQRGSAAATDVLDASKEQVDPNKVYAYIYDQVDLLRSYGTKEANSIADDLDAYRKRLMGEHWARVPATKAKKLIQGLDQITQYGANPTAFDKAKNKSFKGVRATLDEALKESVPEYRAAMEPVAQDAAVLSKGIERFGDPQRGVSTLGQIGTEKGAFDLDLLKRVESATGKQGLISGAAEEFRKSQDLLKDPAKLKAMKESLPEFKAYREAMADLARRNPKATRQQLERALEGSKEAKALRLAEAKLSKAEEAAAPLSGLSVGNSESKIRTVMRGEDKNFEARKLLGRASEKVGTDIVREVDDRAILESFEKGITNGSRNTVLGAAVGLAIGGVPGAAAGAAFGRTVLDRYGPKTGQIILDGIVKAKGSTLAEKIRNLPEVSPAVKADLEKRLFVITNSSSRGSAGGKNVASTEDNKDRKPTGQSAFERRLKSK